MFITGTQNSRWQSSSKFLSYNSQSYEGSSIAPLSHLPVTRRYQYSLGLHLWISYLVYGDREILRNQIFIAGHIQGPCAWDWVLNSNPVAFVLCFKCKLCIISVWESVSHLVSNPQVTRKHFLVSLFYNKLHFLCHTSCSNFWVFSFKTFGTLFLGKLTQETSPLGKKNHQVCPLRGNSIYDNHQSLCKISSVAHSPANVSVMTSSQHITPSTSP